MSSDARHSVEKSQDSYHGEGHDYVVGSPHLRHASLMQTIASEITDVIAERVARAGSCRVLEIGAGHGTFTDTSLEAGAEVTVTEMSAPSYKHLAERYRDDDRVTVIHDSDGRRIFETDSKFDLILLISVIHHIPDYEDALASLMRDVVAADGDLLTFQDPLWYPRQRKSARALSVGSYFVWRLAQGNLRQGLRTRFRRLRGTYDDTEIADLVEYHVVRQGVDEEAIMRLARPLFETVQLTTYFSTQSIAMQRVGGARFPHNTFGITARRRVDQPT
ncbi:class I SAM-dependent methyltransferase [Williamsia herbipolensis]|uniref:Class I SAM-dependent methyltransferase n=1 Tax=Williamsia herbipolensis TaxID=1603258 RepID=A0AAU4K8C4_9NOCA|nr:class I SAM-dependent methyltransferase [Williamsia herbipolensis]